MSGGTSASSPSFDWSSDDLFAFDGAQELGQAWRDGLLPDPALTVSEWADRHRVLSPRASAEPGRYRTDRTPYMRAIVDALSPAHPARRIVVMKSAQVGFTEGGNCWIGYVIHHAPGPMLAVQPTVELAKRFSRQRIDPLINESPTLRERVKPARSRDAGNTVLSKEFPAGLLVITGANSAVGLRSMPARYLFLDEVDAYPPSADEEGDPVALAEARTRTFSWRSKILLGSTPTIHGLSRIEREYEASDQRRYFVPCPHCGEMQWLKFERLRWDKGKPETAHYECASCDRRIEEHHKMAMLAAGEWRPTSEAQDPGTIGFHISALYSPVGWFSWENIARLWEAATTEEAKRSFKNSVLGETWIETGEAPDWQRLYERRENSQIGIVPRGGLFLTAGADVQKDRIEVDVWAWGRVSKAGSSTTSWSKADPRKLRPGKSSVFSSIVLGRMRTAPGLASRSSRSIRATRRPPSMPGLARSGTPRLRRSRASRASIAWRRLWAPRTSTSPRAARSYVAVRGCGRSQSRPSRARHTASCACRDQQTRRSPRARATRRAMCTCRAAPKRNG
jgi:phage terminase large subunit GpA-like protein